MSPFECLCKLRRGREDECEGAGKVRFQVPESVVVDAGEVARLRYARADHREALLGRIDVFQTAHALYGAVVEGVAPYGVERIGGVDDYAAFFEDFHNLVEIALVDACGIHFIVFHRETEEQKGRQKNRRETEEQKRDVKDRREGGGQKDKRTENRDGGSDYAGFESHCREGFEHLSALVALNENLAAAR